MKLSTMKVVTLTTDMGLSDHYVASLKGTLLKSVPDVTIVDVTHTVRPFNVSEAAFHIKSCYKDFPDGTIHVIGVDSEPFINFNGFDGSFPCIMEYDNQFFISLDNGFFGAFLKEEKPKGIWQIDNVLSNTKKLKFPTKNILLSAAIQLLKGETIDSIGTAIDQYKNALSMTAISETNLIKGYVVHIDNYGNAITNISEDLFYRFGNNTPFIIYFKRKDYYIDKISQTYNEVNEGDRVAIFNENGFLEIAINRGAKGSAGGAEQLFGLRINDMIRIEFTPQGSRTTIDSLF